MAMASKNSIITKGEKKIPLVMKQKSEESDKEKVDLAAWELGAKMLVVNICKQFNFDIKNYLVDEQKKSAGKKVMQRGPPPKPSISSYLFILKALEKLMMKKTSVSSDVLLVLEPVSGSFIFQRSALFWGLRAKAEALNGNHDGALAFLDIMDKFNAEPVNEVVRSYRTVVHLMHDDLKKVKSNENGAAGNDIGMDKPLDVNGTIAAGNGAAMHRPDILNEMITADGNKSGMGNAQALSDMGDTSASAKLEEKSPVTMENEDSDDVSQVDALPCDVVNAGKRSLDYCAIDEAKNGDMNKRPLDNGSDCKTLIGDTYEDGLVNDGPYEEAKAVAPYGMVNTPPPARQSKWFRYRDTKAVMDTPAADKGVKKEKSMLSEDSD